MRMDMGIGGELWLHGASRYEDFMIAIWHAEWGFIM